MTIWHPLIDPDQKGATADSNLDDMEVIRRLSDLRNTLSSEINNVSIFTPLEIEYKQHQIHKLDVDHKEAMQAMVLGNIPLVMYKVESYIALYPELAFLHDDLVSAGVLDLTESVHRLANILPIPEGGGNPTGYISQRIIWAIGKFVEEDTKNKVPENYSPPPRSEVDPTSIVDTQDLLDAACQTHEDMIIMEMRERGSTDQEVADRLGIARSSVRVQRHELMQRYDNLVQETL